MAHKVVIIGGGFGGLYAAQALRHAPVEVTLVDRRNFHLFQPLLYQVATGSLAPGEIASPLRFLLRGQKNARVLLAEATGMDVTRRCLLLADGELPYDTLVIATGSQTHYFDSEWESIAPGLKTVEDATTIRHKIFRAFEAAEREPDPELRRAWLTFVVVGAGPTGVELAGALADIATDTLKNDFRNINTKDSQIVLLDAAPRVLSAYPKDLSHDAERQLIRLGVLPRTGAFVKEIDEHGVTYALREPDKPERVDRIRSKTVIWAAGVRPSRFAQILESEAGCELSKDHRVRVTPQLHLSQHPEIFVVGDLAFALDQEGSPLPGLAPVAMQQGRYVASVIAQGLQGRGKQPKPFRYSDRGSLAVIGRNAAVGLIRGRSVTGWFAWITWLFIHLMYLAGALNRVMVLIRWAYQYFSFNRGSRLITGGSGEGSRKAPD